MDINTLIAQWANKTGMDPVKAKAYYLDKLQTHPFLSYTPHAIQLKFHSSKKRIRWFLGGNRSGKTRAGAQEIIWWATGLHPYKLIQPPVEIWAVSLDFPTSRDVVQKVIRHLLGAKYLKRWYEADKIVELTNGSTIGFKSVDAGWVKFQGTAKNIIWFDEEPTYDVYKECLMRIVDKKGHIIGTMTPTHGMCFDEETDILTKKGWCKYNEVYLGDEILTFNKDKRVTEWKTVKGLYLKQSSGLMTELKHQNFDALVTENHRWCVIDKITDELRVVETKDLKKHYKIPRVAEFIQHPQESIYSDDYVKLMGWVVTEGHYRKNRRGVNITQSLSRYPKYCQEINEILEAIPNSKYIHKDYPYWNGSKGVASHWQITGELAERLRKDAPGKVPTMDFLLALTKEQKEILYETIINGDGNRTIGGDRLVDINQDIIDFYQVLCFLLGKQSQSKLENHKYIRLHINKVGGRYESFTHVCSLEIKNIPYTGIIWCPQTDNETVVARRNSTIYISSNTWVMDEIYEPWENGLAQDIECFTSSIYENPHVGVEEKKFIEDKFYDEEKEARLTGRFVAFSGLIYKEFNPNIHSVKRFDIPKHWTRYRGIDPGINNPTACVWWAIDPDNNHYVYDEYYKENMTVEENSRNIKSITGTDEIVATYIDPSAGNRNMAHPELRSVRDEYTKFDIFTIPANNDVSFGINKIKELFKVNEKTKHPRLFIFNDCFNTLKELKRYRWDKHRHHKEEKSPKEKPAKVMDHIMDAMRYIAAADPQHQAYYLYNDYEEEPQSNRRFTKYG